MEKPIVTISEGQIQGTILKSVLGPSYYAFKGIPYAAPPVGPLRFKEPQSPKKWDGVRDASDYAGAPCAQHRYDLAHEIIGSENCLYVNVYTKTLNRQRPVMVFIHGGQFVEGTSNKDVYRQDYLVTQDVVLVYINYRIGPVGFLNLGHEVLPSNIGLRDILYSLQWVQKNIEAFGGDPNNVTVFGHSAGAMISHLLTMLPKAKGLIHKAIIQSGTGHVLKSLVSKFNIKNGFRIAARLGMHSDDPVQVLEFLRNVPVEKLVECEDYIRTPEEAKLYVVNTYEPIVDADYSSDPVVPGTIDELQKNAVDIPIIVGCTSNEDLLELRGRFTDETYKFFDDKIELIVKYKLKDPNYLSVVMKDIKEFYLKNKPINKENVWNLVRLLSDFWLHGNRKFVDHRNEHVKSPTYVYNFSYLGSEPTIYQTDHDPQPLQGVAHGDELSYLFYLAYMQKRKEKPNKLFPKEGTLDRVVMERLVRMWCNFATTGNPTPSTDEQYITTVWEPSSKDHLYYLDIGRELVLRDDKESKSRQFYEKHGKYFEKF